MLLSLLLQLLGFFYLLDLCFSQQWSPQLPHPGLQTFSSYASWFRLSLCISKSILCSIISKKPPPLKHLTLVFFILYSPWDCLLFNDKDYDFQFLYYVLHSKRITCAHLTVNICRANVNWSWISFPGTLLPPSVVARTQAERHSLRTPTQAAPSRLVKAL